MPRPHLAIAIACGLACLAGCGGDGATLTGQSSPDLYRAAVTPDSLMHNFVLAWREMDVDAYRRVLHDGETPAGDGAAYAPFRYYFWRDPDTPADEPWTQQTLEQELTNAGRLFSGRNGANGTPGIREIAVQLEPEEDWERLLDAERIYDEPDCPPELWRRRYRTTMDLELKGPLPDNPEIVDFHVTGRAEFVVIPVRPTPEGPAEYRLWKWRDVRGDE